MSKSTSNSCRRWVVHPQITSSSLHRPLPFFRHLYCFPFLLFIYPTWLYLYFYQYDIVFGNREWTFLSVIFLFSFNVLIFLLGEWSVSLKAKISCKFVNSPIHASTIRIVPAENCGSGALCPIIRSRICHNSCNDGDESCDESNTYTSDEESDLNVMSNFLSQKGVSSSSQSSSLLHNRNAKTRVSPKNSLKSSFNFFNSNSYNTNDVSLYNFWFVFQREKFVYDHEKGYFCPINYPDNIPISDYRSSAGFTCPDDVECALLSYGKNIFDIPLPTFSSLFREHAVAPFFVFQIFCVLLWAIDDYWYYSVFTLFLLFFFESTVVYQRLRTIREFSTLSQSPHPIYVYRNLKWSELPSSSDIVPGDILSLVTPSNDDILVPCDLVLLSGSVIVNEAMLSGESTPLLKESIITRNPDDILSEDLPEDSLHIVHGGTKIVQIVPANSTFPIETSSKCIRSSNLPSLSVPPPPNNGCVAYAVRTGFGTTQGRLVRMMIFSSERMSANNAESFKFIVFLLVFAVFASAYVFFNSPDLDSYHSPDADSDSEPGFDSSDPKVGYIGLGRGRASSKLILHCIMIITSVVPPELPLQLSMAVNSSLLALSKKTIFCTEPFRIPFAGKLDFLCFDKTGTITDENLVVEGVAGVFNPLGKISLTGLCAPISAPRSTVLVIASAHSLVKVDDPKKPIIGDPMERAALEAISFELVKTDTVCPSQAVEAKFFASGSKIQILRKYAFSSSLKRMSTVAELCGKSGFVYAAVKGAPEIIATLLATIPPNYEQTYKQLARSGSRVLALAWKCFDGRPAGISELPRESVECHLTFAGFLVFSSPLKPDSHKAIKALNDSSHRCVMITGDNALTACHVARQVDIATRDCLILDLPTTTQQKDNSMTDKNVFEQKLTWVDAGDKVISNFRFSKVADLVEKYDLCMTGRALAHLEELNMSRLREIICYIYVWARVSPQQKELILKSMKEMGFYTMMCGDGTNDVGALKQAHVGVALLACDMKQLQEIGICSQLRQLRKAYDYQCSLMRKLGGTKMPAKPAMLESLERSWRTIQESKGIITSENLPSITKSSSNGISSSSSNSNSNSKSKHNNKSKKNLAGDSDNPFAAFAESLAQAGDEDSMPTLNLGDASVSAPFTSKLGSLMSITRIVNEGRCALVTTFQMYKIMALNSLISAYSLSVLFLEGIKWGDWQLTVHGIVVTVSFFSISRGSALEHLSRERPQRQLFSLGVVLSLLAQFAVHSVSLWYVTRLCKSFIPSYGDNNTDVKGQDIATLAQLGRPDFDGKVKFVPNVLNTGIFLLSMSMSAASVGINYIGRPFREDITESKVLFRGLVASVLFSFVAALELLPDLNRGMELVEMPPGFTLPLCTAMAADIAMSFLLDRLITKIFLKSTIRKELRINYDKN